MNAAASVVRCQIPPTGILLLSGTGCLEGSKNQPGFSLGFRENLARFGLRECERKDNLRCFPYFGTDRGHLLSATEVFHELATLMRIGQTLYVVRYTLCCAGEA